MNANAAAIASTPSACANASRAHRLSPELFNQVRQAYKAAAHAKALSAASIAAWALLRGADPAKGFCAVTNARKLANGQRPWGARDDALRACANLSTTALAPWAALLESRGVKAPRWFGWEAQGDELLIALREVAAQA